MTSKNSFLANLWENIKRRNWVVFVTFLTFFVYFPGAISIFLNQEVRNLVTEADRLRMTVSLATFFGSNIFTILLASTLGCLAGIQGFAWLHNRKKVDFYYSQPVSRERRYGILYLNGILIYLVCYVLNLLLGVAVAAAYGVFSGQLFQAAMSGLAENFLLFLCMYHLAILAVALTGNTLISILALAVLSGYELLTRLMLVLYADTFLEGFYDYKTEQRFHTWTSPLEVCFRRYYDYELRRNGQPYHTIGMLLGMALIFGILAFLAFRNRPAESYGKSFAFVKMKEPVRILLQLVLGMAGGIFIYEISGASVVFGVLGILFTTLLVHIFSQLFYEFDFKSILKKKLSFVISAVLTLFVFFAFYFDIFGYSDYVPKRTKVESVSLQLEFDGYYYNGGGTRILEDGTEIGNLLYMMNYMRLTDLDTVYALIEAKTPFVRGNENYWGEDEYYVDLAYHLKNGKTVYRKIRVNYAENMDLVEKIYAMPEYQAATNQLTDEKFYEQYKIKEIQLFNGETYEDVPTEYLKELTDAYRKDVLTTKLSKLYGAIPTACLEFRGEGIRNNHYTNYWEVSIYDSFMNTLAVLEKAGLKECLETEPKAEEVIRIEVSYMDYEAFRAAGPTVVNSEDFRAYASYTDKEEIIQILESSVNENFRYRALKSIPGEGDYDIYVFRLDEKGEEYSTYRQFKIGAVPQFVNLK